ncbi:MAG: hypothetical protein ABIR17_10815 [Pseudolysinimonas sp.]|uniref:hypothetical protein n=1 Tax=Pseudolysinimonas sp. TaxID=2680009 RepID=UPI003264DE22
MTEPTTVLRANRRRRLARRVAMIAATPILVLVLLLGVKVLSMYAFAYQSAAAYAAGDYAGTVQAARWQEPLNFFEPYKAPFNVGVGLTGSGDLTGARAAFEESLGLAHGLEQCAVRVNLAIVIERIGDAAATAGDRAAASAAWQQALLVMLEGPEGCPTPEADAVSPDPTQNMEDTMTEEERRLREKLADGSGTNQSPPPDETPPPPTPDDGQISNIEEQLQQGTDERDDYLDGQQGDGGSGTDRPW